jgi:hypothetical protein
LFWARIGAIAAGYPDCNDLNRLRVDPALRLFSGQRLPMEKSRSGTNQVLAGQYQTGSLEARLAAKRGQPVPSGVPPATNIRVTKP